MRAMHVWTQQERGAVVGTDDGGWDRAKVDATSFSRGLAAVWDNSPIRPPGSESTPVETHEKPHERGVYEAGIRAFLTTWFQTNRWSRVLFNPIGFWSRSGDTVTGLAGTVLSCKEINPFQARRRLRILARSVRPVI